MNGRPKDVSQSRRLISSYSRPLRLGLQQPHPLLREPVSSYVYADHTSKSPGYIEHKFDFDGPISEH
jgi:hypothetical protein